jgi:hypothetical protein
LNFELLAQPFLNFELLAQFTGRCHALLISPFQGLTFVAQGAVARGAVRRTAVRLYSAFRSRRHSALCQFPAGD